MTLMFIGASFYFCTRLYWVYTLYGFSIRLLLAIFKSLFQLVALVPNFALAHIAGESRKPLIDKVSSNESLVDYMESPTQKPRELQPIRPLFHTQMLQLYPQMTLAFPSHLQPLCHPPLDMMMLS